MDPLKVTPPPEAKLHFLDYWRIIRIRKTVILAVFLLVVITATIVTFILPEAYSSKARNTSLIDITVYSDDKTEAAQIANTIADAYHDYRAKVRLELTLGGIKAFE